MKAADNELRDLLTGTGTGTALTSLNGIGLSGAARLLIEASDISRFPSKVHFASWNARPDRRVAWGPGPPPPDRAQATGGSTARAAHHGRRPVAPPRQRKTRLLRTARSPPEDTQGTHEIPQAPALRRRLPPEGPRRTAARKAGPGEHLGAGTDSRAACLHLGAGTSEKSLPDHHRRPSPPRPARSSGHFPPLSPAGPQPLSSALLLDRGCDATSGIEPWPRALRELLPR